jgi:hypothetical protein
MLPFLLPGVVVAVDATRRVPLLFAAVVGSVVVAIVVYATSSALFPHFPERFGNPLYDVTFALLRDGAAAPNVGSALGVVGTAGLLPYFAILVGVVGATVHHAARPRWPALAGVAIAIMVIAAYHWFPRANVESQRAYRDYVLGAMPPPQRLW